MSKLIAMVIGAWVMYCSMIGSCDGAITILTVYLLTLWIDPFYLRRNKKGTTAANSRTENK